MIMFFGSRGCGRKIINTPEGVFNPNANVMMSFYYFHLKSAEERRRLRRIKKTRRKPK